MGLVGLTAAIGCVAASGLPGMLAARRSALGQTIAVTMATVGCAIGLVIAVAALAGGEPQTLDFPWALVGMRGHLRLDSLSAFFLVPIFLVGAAGSIYGLGYWRQADRPRTAPRLQLWYGLLLAAMAAIVVAADSVLFLFAWEIMALAAFFLVSTEEHKPDVRQAAWLYLACTHACTLVLFALFALLRAASGTFELKVLAAGPGMRTAIFLTALVGFGLKAGVMPLHFWLPSAHASAPSHVSAILSGIMLKLGIYGLLRTLSLLPNPPAIWGGLILLAGTASAVLGVLFAIGQHDLKRLLAYHSIENIGIILMGLGLALLGQARGRADWVALGLAGCLLHVWNHALFKSLLFFAAGSVVHAMRTREIDRMGGLARRMPATAALFFIGAAAICGLPPLNGFISELFVYLGLLGALNGAAAASLATPFLALVGALAVACFVKAYGAVFLGTPRTLNAERAHEGSIWMTVPMVLLAACCVAIGVAPVLVAPALNRVIGQWTGTPVAIRSLAPLGTLTIVNASLAAFLLLACAASAKRWLKSPLQRSAGTWDCGYARPTARMQYTASSFAQTIVGVFRGVLRPHSNPVRIGAPFPQAAEHFHSHVGDVVLDRVLTPGWRGLRSALRSLRGLQQGSVQRYLLYILLILILLLLLFAVPFSDLLRPIWGAEPH